MVNATRPGERLHDVLQAAFGWTDHHLHRFGLFKQWGDYFTRPAIELVMNMDEEWERTGDEIVLPIEGVKLSDHLPEYTKVLYTYDFGDEWRHYIEVDAVVDDCEEVLPVLLSGQGDAPPEDVGGATGWTEFLEIMADPAHPDHQWTTAWAKEQWWQPFDFDRTARRIAAMAWAVE